LVPKKKSTPTADQKNVWGVNPKMSTFTKKKNNSCWELEIGGHKRKGRSGTEKKSNQKRNGRIHQDSKPRRRGLREKETEHATRRK